MTAAACGTAVLGACLRTLAYASHGGALYSLAADTFLETPRIDDQVAMEVGAGAPVQHLVVVAAAPSRRMGPSCCGRFRGRFSGGSRWSAVAFLRCSYCPRLKNSVVDVLKMKNSEAVRPGNRMIATGSVQKYFESICSAVTKACPSMYFTWAQTLLQKLHRSIGYCSVIDPD